MKEKSEGWLSFAEEVCDADAWDADMSQGYDIQIDVGSVRMVLYIYGEVDWVIVTERLEMPG